MDSRSPGRLRKGTSSPPRRTRRRAAFASDGPAPSGALGVVGGVAHRAKASPWFVPYTVACRWVGGVFFGGVRGIKWVSRLVMGFG